MLQKYLSAEKGYRNGHCPTDSIHLGIQDRFLGTVLEWHNYDYGIKDLRRNDWLKSYNLVNQESINIFFHTTRNDPSFK